jgi:hypothetical protein
MDEYLPFSRCHYQMQYEILPREGNLEDDVSYNATEYAGTGVWLSPPLDTRSGSQIKYRTAVNVIGSLDRQKIYNLYQFI